MLPQQWAVLDGEHGPTVDVKDPLVRSDEGVQLGLGRDVEEFPLRSSVLSLDHPRPPSLVVPRGHGRPVEGDELLVKFELASRFIHLLPVVQAELHGNDVPRGHEAVRVLKLELRNELNDVGQRQPGDCAHSLAEKRLVDLEDGRLRLLRLWEGGTEKWKEGRDVLVVGGL